MEYYYSSVIMLVIMINACHKIDAYLNGIPRDTEVKINDSTFMNCSTSLLANQVQWRHGNNYVYTGISILEPYNERFSVEINALTGDCNLVIRSVKPSDVGIYECADDEGIGDRRSVQLIVLDDDPVCKSSMRSDGVIGPNSCRIEPEEVEFSCSIKYHGSILPVLQLRVSGDNQCIADGRFKVTSSNTDVTYTLTMRSTLGLNNSSFVCQTTRTSNKHYSCSSKAIHILYVLSSEATINITMNKEVNCFANTSQSCSYKWKWISGYDSTTESDNQILKPKKVGMHRCEATCSIRNKSCTVQSMHATVYLEEASRKSFLALLLVPALAVIGVIIYFWRKRNVKKRRRDEIRREREEHDEKENERLIGLGLIATIRTKAAEKGKKRIFGLTILDNELFVVSEDSSEVEVYDSMKFSFSRRLNLKKLIRPWDIASCNRNKCLYIFDDKDGGRSREILRVGPNGKLTKKWSTKDNAGQLSVTYESKVILIAQIQNKLIEYSTDGQFIREIILSSEEGFCHPLHAIKLTNGHFVVSHSPTKNKDGQHRVCIVDTDGKLFKSFGGERGSTIEQTYDPCYLSVDGNGSILVADFQNSRILQLDSDLKFKGEILSREHGLHDPTRIHLDESNGRLFVADNEWNNNRIFIFKL